MADDKDEGRMLIALNALIDGQKRTLRMVETAIDRYSTIGTELTKLNRKLNASHELALRNHGEVSQRIDVANDLALRNHGEVSQRIDAVNDQALRNHSDVLHRLDTVQEAALRSQNAVMTRLDAIAARLEEVERLEDERAREIKEIHVDLVSQYNDILSAIQMASNSVADTRDFRERLEQLERRLGM